MGQHYIQGYGETVPDKEEIMMSGYQKASGNLMLLGTIFLLSIICVGELNKVKTLSDEPVRMLKLDDTALTQEQMVMGIPHVFVSEKHTMICDTLENDSRMTLDEEEMEVLLRIVESEAGGEDEDGKLLVANVVFNRVMDEDFPGTIKEVVFEKNNGVSQFSPVSNGRFWSVEISEETRKAVERALNGEDISRGALYFVARQYADQQRMKWFDRHRIFLFSHGGHEFFG